MEGAERFWALVNTDPCWEWQGNIGTGGYGYATRLDKPNGATIRAHRYAYELTKGPIPPGLVVMHLCDNPRCVRPDHLALGTQKENIAHRVERAAQGGKAYRGLSRTGVQNGRAKVTAEQVRVIRARHAAGELQTNLCREFGLSQANMSRIVLGLRWKSVPLASVEDVQVGAESGG